MGGCKESIHFHSLWPWPTFATPSPFGSGTVRARLLGLCILFLFLVGCLCVRVVFGLFCVCSMLCCFFCLCLFGFGCFCLIVIVRVFLCLYLVRNTGKAPLHTSAVVFKLVRKFTGVNLNLCLKMHANERHVMNNSILSSFWTVWTSSVVVALGLFLSDH